MLQILKFRPESLMLAWKKTLKYLPLILASALVVILASYLPINDFNDYNPALVVIAMIWRFAVYSVIWIKWEIFLPLNYRSMFLKAIALIELLIMFIFIGGF